MNKNIKSPLAIIFICAIVIVSVLNMSTFITTYKTNIIEADITNKQTALSSLETEYQNQIAGKTNYLDLNGLFARLIDKKELNERYKLNNGYLTDAIVNYYNPIAGITNISNLKRYLDLYDIPFAYVQTPILIPSDDDPMMPLGYETHANGNLDRLLEGLENNGVNYLDLRENLKEDEINHYDIYLKTDHHWTNEGGFLSHKYISQLIDEVLGEDLLSEEYFIESRYNTTVFNNEFLGSLGERTGVFFAGVDDVIVITPNFNTNFTTVDKNGKFEDVFIDYELLEVTFDDTLTKTVSYKIYDLNGNYFKIINENSPNDKKIMILRDSFTASIAPFLALHYKEIHLYDVRYGDKEAGFIQKLHEINPDIVLQVRTTTNHLTDEAKAEI